MRGALAKLLAAMLLFPLGCASEAEAYCDPHFVNGNETRAPADFGASLERHDWVALAPLLTDKISVTIVSGDTRTADGKDAALQLIKNFWRENSGSYRGDRQNGIEFGKVNLMANHWVTARILPHFKEEKYRPGEVPPLPLHGPIYYASYSAAFLPDCEGKIVRIVIVERNLIDG